MSHKHLHLPRAQPFHAVLHQPGQLRSRLGRHPRRVLDQRLGVRLVSQVGHENHQSKKGRQHADGESG